MKRFKGKKRFNNLIIYVGIFLLSIAFSIKYLYEENLIKNDTLVSLLLNNNLNNENNINDVDFLLKYVLNISLLEDERVDNTNNNFEKLEVTENELLDEPIVYIYNTHQEEKYKNTYLAEYNISSGVFLASKILKEYLEDLGIKVIVEENNITDKLHSLNLKYGSSYKISRMFMETAYKEHPSLKYFIDIHRDSSKYEKTTAEIDGEKYAKLLFVVGLDNDNYELNLKLAEKLKEKIKMYNENLFRGIMKKSGAGVNGIYNQDFSPNAMLVEVGGQYNNISEVNNTLQIFAKILSNYIKEDQNE